MKHKYLKRVFLSSFLLAGLTATTAQESRGLKQIKFENSSKISLQKAPNLIRTKLKLTANDNLQKIKSEIDNLGFTHEKYQQKFKGVKVEFGTYTAHAKNSTLRTMDGELYNVEKVNITPKLSKAAAFKKAIAHTGAQKYLWEVPAEAKNLGNYKKPTGELLILPKEVIGTTDARLAYKFDIYSVKPLSRGNLYIDAHTGEALFFNAIIKHLDEHAHSSKNLGAVAVGNLAAKFTAAIATGNAATRYSGTKSITTRVVGSSYALRDNTRGGGVNTYNSGGRPSYSATNFTDADNNWTAAEFDNSLKDNAALDAHWGAEMTYDYFQSKHSRNSYNGSNAAINSYVHYDDVAGGLGYDNAFWNGSVMTYGDGSSNGNEGNGNFDALTSIDVAAHEIGHAVCSSTANLAYQRESGGLNEGFSDIWGAAVEHFAKGNGNDALPDASVWLIGDEIDRRNGASALRSMSNPNERNQPDTYGGSFWKEPNCGAPTRANDYCGVHTNSGVLNYWFYLLTVGGSGTNDVNNAFSVEGIGMTKSAKISYRLEVNYLSANATFADARSGAITAASDLYGADSEEVKSVTNAWHAVGVGEAFGAGSTPSVCTSTINSFPYNESFESGVGAWTQSTSDSFDWTRDANGTPSGSTGPAAAAAGSFYMYTEASNPNFPTKTAIFNSPCFDLTSVSNPIMKFKYHMYGSSMGTLKLEVQEEGATIWTEVWSKSGDQGNSWEDAIVNLSSNKVKVRFNLTTASSYTSDAAIDAISVISGSSSSDTTAPTVVTNLVESNITETTATLNWSASTDNIGVTGYEIFQGTTSVGNVTETTANITGLTANTSYTYSIKAKDAAGNVSASSNNVTFTTLETTVTYCESKGNRITYEWIDFVSFGGMTNTTGANGGYGDFTSKIATVSQGSTNQLIISAGFASTAYTEFFTVWIDFNQNGTFESDEEVTTGSSNSAANRTADITIPASVKLGTTRMRVSMKYNTKSTACENFSDGEVEDYTVNINANTINSVVIAGIEPLGDEAISSLTVYPNPSADFIQVKLASSSNNMTYRIVNVIGGVVQSGRLSTSKLNVRNLNSGIYILEINDGQKIQTTKLLKK